MRIRSLVLAVAAALCVGAASAHDLAVTKDGQPAAEGADYSWDGDKLTILNAGLTVGGTTTKERIVVAASAVTLDNLNVTLSDDGVYCINTTAAACTLTMTGENTIQATGAESTGIVADRGLTIGGSGTVTLTTVTNAIFAVNDIVVGESVNVAATTTGTTACIRSDEGNVTFETSGRVDITPKDGNGVLAVVGDVEIKGSGSVVVDVGDWNAIAGADVAIGGSANVTLTSTASSAIWADDDITISSDGVVSLATESSSALGCEGKLIIAETATRVVARGCEAGECGALELYDTDALALPEGWVAYGSTDQDAKVVDIAQKTAYKQVEGGEWGAYTCFVGDEFAQAVTFAFALSGGSKDNPWQVGATDADSVVAWTNGTGKLTVEGTGAMRDFSEEVIPPWESILDSITAVEIAEGVTSVGDEAFFLCGKLASVTIPFGVKRIGKWAFSYCGALTGVTIPDGVAVIDENAFSYCGGLKSVTIPSSVESIGYAAFHSCGKLASVTIQPGVKTIGPSAFYKCVALKEVSIPSSVTDIGEQAFAECGALESVTIPEGVVNIGSMAFYQCFALKGVEFPSSVESIGTYAFYDCESLESVAIPEKVTSIGEGVFGACVGLTSVTIPSSVTSLGVWAFWHCESLANVEIPSSVKSIGNQAFNGCLSLERVTIPSSVESVGDYAFYQCGGLTSVTIAEGVKSIGTQAFIYCDGLTHVTIPTSVESIGSYAFYGCDELVGVKMFRVDPPTIGTGCFSECESLLAIIVPAESIETYKEAGGWTTYEEKVVGLAFMRPPVFGATGRMRELLSVPWLGLDGEGIALDDYIMPDNLAAGDLLYIYDREAKGYDCYEFGEDKLWHAAVTLRTKDGEVAASLAEEPEVVRIPVGTAVWIERADAAKPLLFIGLPVEDKVDFRLEPGYNLVSAPGDVPFNLTDITEAAEGDRVILPFADREPQIFTRGADGWSFPTNAIITIGGETVVKPTKVTDPARMTIPAGLGFLYERKAK